MPTQRTLSTTCPHGASSAATLAGTFAATVTGSLAATVAVSLAALLGAGAVAQVHAQEAAAQETATQETATQEAAAQEAAAQETVTLEEAVRRALERSPQVAQTRQQLVNAAQTRRTARGSFLPSLSASFSGSLRSQERFDEATDRIVTGSSDSYSAGLNADYDVFDGGRRFDELEQSAAEVRAAEASLADQRWAVTFQTEEIFFQALRQEELTEVARARIRQAEESLELTRRRAQLGVATTSDTLRARLERVNAEQALLEAETALRNARVALGRQVGQAGPVAPVPPEDLDPRPLDLPSEEILALAEDRAPSVEAARASTAAAGAAVSAARASYLPSLTLRSGYDWANQGASLEGGSTSWNLNLGVSYPLFNGFQREASVVRARETFEVSRFREEDARLFARQEADRALHALRTAARATEIAGEAVFVAEEDLRVVRERYRVGVATILDVVTSQVALDQARVDLVNARFDHVLARAELEAIVGREL